MRKELCLVFAMVAAVTAQGEAYYRVVQGRIIPKSDRNWTVFREKIKVMDFMGGAIKCAIYVTEDVHGTAPQVDTRGRVYQGATEHTQYKLKEYIILTNYPNGYGLARGSDITPPIMAMRIGSVPLQGTYSVGAGSSGGGSVNVGGPTVGASVGSSTVSGSYTGSSVEIAVYDYGVDWYPPPPVRKTSAKSPSASGLAGGTNQLAGATSAERPTLTDVEARALKFNQEQAAAGNPSGLYRMGVRYRDGEGVEKDLRKAREMLKKAADGGHPDAAAELEKLPLP
jgi:TPR repeat protein